MDRPIAPFLFLSGRHTRPRLLPVFDVVLKRRLLMKVAMPSDKNTNSTASFACLSLRTSRPGKPLVAHRSRIWEQEFCWFVGGCASEGCRRCCSGLLALMEKRFRSTRKSDFLAAMYPHVSVFEGLALALRGSPELCCLALRWYAFLVVGGRVMHGSTDWPNNMQRSPPCF